MITILLALLAITFAEVSVADTHLFASWTTTHKKAYASPEEHAYRLSVFAANADFVRKWDANARGFTVGLNLFADLTNEEFRAMYNGLNISVTIGEVKQTVPRVGIPASVDWRKEGIVTPVKNQRQCGSCWAFSTTGSVEGAHAQATKQLVSLSEQNLVDCSVPQGNHGCNGGLMDSAFRYIISNHGIDTEASYPYTATGPNSCRYNAATRGATITSFRDVPRGSEAGLADAVALHVVSVAIDASHSSFQLYTGGVYNEPRCSSTQLDHGVLAVGYGDQNGTPYWLVKNSWGANWGLSGYILMSRNRNNQCGIATSSSYPIV
jgi:cathepsin L